MKKLSLAAGAAAILVATGASAQDYYTPPEPEKVKPGLSLRVTPKIDRRAPIRFTGKGLLDRNGVGKLKGCRGVVTVRIKRGRRTIARKAVPVQRASCRYFATKIRIGPSKLAPRGRLRMSARFSGNRRLTKVVSRTVVVRYSK